MPPGEGDSPGSRSALLVTSGTYDDPELRRLTSPREDASALATTLRRPDIGGFVVRRCHNRRSHEVMRRVEEFFAGAKPDDVRLLYFSGHGLKDDSGSLFLATRDTQRSRRRSTAISDDFLRSVMRESRAATQILILDCCFGGAFSKGLLAKGDDKVDVNDRFQGTGRVVLTASTAMEFSYESGGLEGDASTSVFTGLLVQGLRTGDADVDRDGNVSVQDAYRFTYKRLSVGGSKQTPTISTVGQEGEIYLASVPQARRRIHARQVPPPRPAQDLSEWVTIGDQGAEGSSAAFAAVTAMETSLAYQGKRARLSRRYVYQKAKALDGSPLDQDTGAMMETAMRVISELGVPFEKTWPYVAGEIGLPKGRTWDWMDEHTTHNAVLYPVNDYDELAFHLSRGRPIVAGFTIHEEWMTASAGTTGFIDAPAPDSRMIGGHPVVIVGIDASRGFLRFANSWGTGWGDHGFGWMDGDAARRTLSGDQMWGIEVRLRPGFRWSDEDDADANGQ